MRSLLVLAAVLGALGVVAGAFGAHALRSKLPAELMGVYQTAVLYHLVHALGAALVALWLERHASSLAALAGWLLVAGVLLFSGSLYALALSGVRALGAVTPFGGLAFVAGWLCFAWAVLRA